jgi:oligopeptide/dipeptide ABC transporter ATP-binding protein
MNPVLQIEGLSIDFRTDRGEVTVVSGVDLTVGAHEAVGLVGESGSGKTVTCLSVLGLIPQPPGRISGGRILLEGTDLLQVPTRELEDVRGSRAAMIFQEPMAALNPVLTIGDQIAESVRRHQGVRRRAARNRAVDVLGMVGIPDPRGRLDSYPHEMSGGMCQRVMIAMALANEPKLLIADEPTTALDVTIQAQVLDLLRELIREMDMSVLFVTHDLGVVADLCDRVVVMYAGQVVESGDAGDVFRRPTHPYTEGLLASVPSARVRRERLATVPGIPPAPWAFPAGCRFHDRCPYADARCTSTAPPLVAGPGGSLSRCLRTDELVLAGAP